MIPPLAITPLITHIPHAVPVVILWGIMLRFYFVQRKQKSGRDSAIRSDPARLSPGEQTGRDRPVTRRVWAADEATGTTASGRYDEVPAAGRTPAGRH